jgi:FkbH-like protein
MSFFEMIKLFELKIYETAKKHTDVYILNIDAIVEGHNKQDCIKSHQGYPYGHLTYLGSSLVAEVFYNQLSYLEKSIERVKCVVLDLDNTLWKGVLIEDGPDKVIVNQQICNILYGLVQRGIVLALCSKNETSMKNTIFDIIKKDLYGQHIVKYICSWRINWDPKSINLLDIAKELNIGANTVAFFDDSEFERTEVKTNASDILVYTDKDIFYTLNNPLFNPIGGVINATTEKRLNTYISNKDRKVELKTITENSDNNDPFTKFMINSNFILTIHFAEENELQRIFEVIHRTNQMNATLCRTNLEKIREYFGSLNYIIYSISLKDKFGDYGNVGTVIININNNTADIIEFAISCRAMGKKVENAIIINIFKYLQSLNIKIVTINLVETEKNKSFVDIFNIHDFVIYDDNMTYIHKLSDKIYEYPIWFKKNNN